MSICVYFNLFVFVFITQLQIFCKCIFQSTAMPGRVQGAFDMFDVAGMIESTSIDSLAIITYIQ